LGGLNPPPPRQIGPWYAPCDGRRGWPLRNTPLPNDSYLADRGRSVLNGVGIDRKEPPKLEALGLHPLATGGARDWVTTSDMVVLRKGCTRKKKGRFPEPPKLVHVVGAFADGAWLTLEIRASPTYTCYSAECGRSRPSVRALLRRSADKCVPPFQVTQGHRNRHGSIRHLQWCDFLLTFHSNHGPILYISFAI